jgi:hypothetical protein
MRAIIIITIIERKLLSLIHWELVSKMMMPDARALMKCFQPSRATKPRRTLGHSTYNHVIHAADLNSW